MVGQQDGDPSEALRSESDLETEEGTSSHEADLAESQPQTSVIPQTLNAKKLVAMLIVHQPQLPNQLMNVTMPAGCPEDACSWSRCVDRELLHRSHPARTRIAREARPRRDRYGDFI